MFRSVKFGFKKDGRSKGFETAGNGDQHATIHKLLGKEVSAPFLHSRFPSAMVSLFRISWICPTKVLTFITALMLPSPHPRNSSRPIRSNPEK